MAFLAVLLAAALPQVQEMTLEEKVGQLLIAHFQGEELNDQAKILLDEAHVGGIIYYSWANGLKNPEQVCRLSSRLQAHASIPLFIAIDQEGGRVSHLKEGFTYFYGNGALGLTQDPVFAEQAAFAMGQEMRAVGINLNFAPVVDLNTFHQAAVDSRSYGDSAEIVVCFGERALHGFHQASLLTTLKHFPGLGSALVDPHLDLPRIEKSEEELWKTDLYPFKELVGMTDLVMTGHVLVPALDPGHCATVSPLILEGLLREKLGFRGLIISDSLIMEGLLKEVSSMEEATIRAFEAGCDLLLLGGKQLFENQSGFELTPQDVLKIQKALVEAVISGRISQERVNASVERILRLKKTLSLEDACKEDLSFWVGTEEHLRLSNRIFDRSLRCAKPIQ